MVRLPFAAGAQSQEPAELWGSAAAVADSTIGAWRTDLMTCRLVQQW